MLFILSWLGICFLGCVLHFLYGWLHHSKFVAWGCAVNESTWEHLKIATMPTLLWAILMLVFSNFNNVAFGTFVMILVSNIFIVAMFYGYKLITKKAILIVDISLFFIGLALGMLCAYFILTTTPLGLIFDIIGYIGNALIFLIFVMFTYFPPKNFLFLDPNIKQAGIHGHNEEHCHHLHKHKK